MIDVEQELVNRCTKETVTAIDRTMFKFLWRNIRRKKIKDFFKKMNIFCSE